MPRNERYPTPLLNMNPAGWAGFGASIVMALGIWSLFGVSFLIGFGAAIIIAAVAALAIRSWRVRHPADESLLHLEPRQQKPSAKDR